MANIKQLKNEYPQIVKEHSPKNKVMINSAKAFLVGGAICTIGQGFTEIYKYYGMAKDDAQMVSTVTLILLSAIFTGFNIYDNIGKFGGAGAAIPITGFANAMVSSAMEFKKEGYVYGMGAKLFTIAGPVIVFGAIASVVAGIIFYFV
ncbi:MAG: stage sporulation protein [Clostridia bacterium]|jgi:stage V sporulation protein AC|nr:stage sporulation protein [Clostridia bacterium]